MLSHGTYQIGIIKEIGNILLILILCIQPVKAGNSVLWGQTGELWDGPASRLPDYSYAGYHYSERDIPDVPTKINIKNFGAKGDGITDDTHAFKKAIAALANGALYIPPGKYMISDILNIRKGNIVLRGAGENKTTLHFTRGMYEIFKYDPASGKRVPRQVVYSSWGIGGHIWVAPPSKSDGGSKKKLADLMPALRGDTVISLTNIQGPITAGDWVVLKLTDNYPRHDLRRHVSVIADRLAKSQVIESGIIKNRRLYWPVKIRAISGNQLTLWQPLKNDIRAVWRPELRKYSWLREVGIEELTIDFPEDEHKEHGHRVKNTAYKEKIYNGIAYEGVLNGWIRNVTIKNAQNGLDLDELSSHVTVRELTLIGKKTTAHNITRGIQPFGHHGLGFNGSQDCLIEYCRIPKSFRHDITVYHMASGNVARKCVGQHIALDHHTRFPYGNLFSDIHVGGADTTRSSSNKNWSYSSGPQNTGPRSAAWETFWNIRSDHWNAPDATGALPYWEFPVANVIPSQSETFSYGRHFERIQGPIEPADLFVSQLARRGFKAYKPRTELAGDSD